MDGVYVDYWAVQSCVEVWLDAVRRWALAQAPLYALP